MDKKYTEKLLVPSYLVDCNENLRPSAFMGLAQELADKGSVSTGTGQKDLARVNLAWIVSRIHIEFHRPVKWQQEVDFQTWHKGVETVFFRREYRMLDASTGQAAIDATYSWLAFDTVNRRLFRTDRLGEYFDISPQSEDSAVPQAAQKIRIPEGLDTELVRTHEVMYSDLDFIGHANNTAYVSWSMDCIPQELATGSYPASLDINFNLETRLGSSVDLFRTMEKTAEGTDIYIEGKVDGVTHFICKLHYL